MYQTGKDLEENENNIFSVCQATWDSDRQQFYRLNKAENVKCCFDRCDKPVNNCKRYCESFLDKEDEKKICEDTCVKQKILCEDSCKAYVDWDKNPFVECVRKSKCFINGSTFLPECIRKNKDELVKCCANSCIQGEDYDCNDLCEFSANISLNLGTKKPKAVRTINSVKQKKHLWFYVVIVVVLIIAAMLFRKTWLS